MKLRRTAVVVGVLLMSVTSWPARAAVPHCVSSVDPKGDESPAVDPSLDITSVHWLTGGKSLTVKITVAHGAGHPVLSFENRFDALFTVNRTDVVMFWKNSPVRSQEAAAFYQQGIRVDNVVASGLVDGGWSGDTLTMSIRYKDLAAALGHPVLAKRFTNLSALARAAYLYNDANVTYDTATSAGSFVGGAACR